MTSETDDLVEGLLRLSERLKRSAAEITRLRAYIAELEWRLGIGPNPPETGLD